MISNRISLVAIVCLILIATAIFVIKFHFVAAASAPSTTGAMVAAVGAVDVNAISILTSTATSTTAETTGLLSEFNKLGISGSCVVTKAANQKQCDISVSYTAPDGTPIVGIPVTILTMDAQGTFTNVDSARVIKNKPGKVIQYSANLGKGKQAIASFAIPADATSTLFIALTPDGLRAQSTFADTTTVR